MDHGFGNELPRAHTDAPHRPPARYLVVIDAGGSMIARLFLANHQVVAEFDAGTEETAQMTRGLVPSKSANGPDWDRALQGHSAAERSAADIYLLDV